MSQFCIDLLVWLMIGQDPQKIAEGQLTVSGGFFN
jgi:hypothetical protein